MFRVLCVHDVVEGEAASPWEVRASDLEQALAHLLENGYQFLNLSAVAAAVPEIRPAVVTIDDAAGGAIAWALERACSFGIQATIFPVVNWLDSPPERSPEHAYRSLASWRDIKAACRQGHEIGSHSMSHTPMHTLPGDRLAFELQESKRRLEAGCGTAVKHFAAPFGKLSSEVIQRAFAAGYSTISSTVPGANLCHDISGQVLKRIVLRSDLPGLGISQEWDRQ